MSMITEFVKELKGLYVDPELDMLCGVDGECRQALKKSADTIEELSAKLQSANMERSSQYYNGGWIPVSEKLPNDRDWYLGIFKEPNTGWINPIPFICDYVGRETKATTKEHWILRGLTDIDNPCDYYLNLECVAWMPLPTPYKESEG